MKIVHQIHQFEQDYVTLCEPVYNTVIANGTFVRFLYSSPTYSLSSIYVELPIRDWSAVQYATASETAGTTFKIKCNFDWTTDHNQEIVKWLSDMETALLEKYEMHRTLSSTTLSPVSAWTLPVPFPSAHLSSAGAGVNVNAGTGASGPYLHSNYTLNEMTMGRLQKTREHGIHTQTANGCIRISNKIGFRAASNMNTGTAGRAGNWNDRDRDRDRTPSTSPSSSIALPLEQNKRWNFRASSVSASASASTGTERDRDIAETASGSGSGFTEHSLSLYRNHSYNSMLVSSSSMSQPSHGLHRKDDCVPLEFNDKNASIVLKITGIWETGTSYGLTFKFQLVSKHTHATHATHATHSTQSTRSHSS